MPPALLAALQGTIARPCCLDWGVSAVVKIDDGDDHSHSTSSENFAEQLGLFRCRLRRPTWRATCTTRCTHSCRPSTCLEPLPHAGRRPGGGAHRQSAELTRPSAASGPRAREGWRSSATLARAQTPEGRSRKGGPTTTRRIGSTPNPRGAPPGLKAANRLRNTRRKAARRSVVGSNHEAPAAHTCRANTDSPPTATDRPPGLKLGPGRGCWSIHAQGPNVGADRTALRVNEHRRASPIGSRGDRGLPERSR